MAAHMTPAWAAGAVLQEHVPLQHGQQRQEWLATT